MELYLATATAQEEKSRPSNHDAESTVALADEFLGSETIQTPTNANATVSIVNREYGKEEEDTNNFNYYDNTNNNDNEMMMWLR